MFYVNQILLLVQKIFYKFLAYIDDFDCIFGTRTHKSLIHKSAKMQLSLRIGNIIVAKILEYMFLGPTLSDVGCTYKVLSREAYQKIKSDLKVVGSEFQPELMINLIFKKTKNIRNSSKLFRKRWKVKNNL